MAWLERKAWNHELHASPCCDAQFTGTLTDVLILVLHRGHQYSCQISGQFHSPTTDAEGGTAVVYCREE